MRAATTLVSQLHAKGVPALPHLWRAHEWNGAGNGTATVSSGFAALDRELPGQGWPQGQLVELLVDQAGIGELGLLLPALAHIARAGQACVWVLPCRPAARAATDATGPALPYPPALLEAGLDLGRNIFVTPETAREAGWALEQSLRSTQLGALVGWLPQTPGGADADFRVLRRLHLLAQQGRSLAFVLRDVRHAQAPSPAALRLKLGHDGQHLQVHLLKRRGRPLLDPLAVPVHPAHWSAGQPAATPPSPAATPPSPAASPGRAPAERPLAQRLPSLSAAAMPWWPSGLAAARGQ